MDDLDELSDYVACDALSQSDYRDIIDTLIAIAATAETDELFEQSLYVANRAALNVTSDFTRDCSKLRTLLPRAKRLGALHLALSLTGICGDAASVRTLETYLLDDDPTVRSEALDSLLELRSKLARNARQPV